MVAKLPMINTNKVNPMVFFLSCEGSGEAVLHQIHIKRGSVEEARRKKCSLLDGELRRIYTPPLLDYLLFLNVHTRQDILHG